MRAGLSRLDLAFIRHGSTAPTTPDIARVLSDKGRAQARLAGSTYLRRIGALAPLVICSAAGRCVETATLALGELAAGSGEIKLVRSQVLYDGTMQPEGSTIFRKLGYAPLRDYYAEGETVRTLLDGYARGALDEIDGIAQRYLPQSLDSERRTLCVFGHAICARVQCPVDRQGVSAQTNKLRCT